MVSLESYERDLAHYWSEQEGLPEGYELEIDDESAEVVGELGSGGSKVVYDVQLSEGSIALALPATTKRLERVADNWMRALREPEMTEKVRETGIPTNDFCEVREAELDGRQLPVLAMRRYEDHDFDIYDANNFHGWHDFLSNYDGKEQLAEKMSPISSDISSLLEKGLLLGRDSFNICDIEGRPRLFINDLSTARTRDEIVDDMATEYVRSSISAFLNTAAPEHVDGTGLYYVTEERERLESELEKLVNRHL